MTNDKKSRINLTLLLISVYLFLFLAYLAVEDPVILKLDAHNINARVQAAHIDLIYSCANINYMRSLQGEDLDRVDPDS